MNIVKKAMMATAAAGLVVAGTASAEIRSAEAIPASSIVRASAPAGETSELRGGSSWLLALLAAALVVGGIVILADGDDSADSPG